MLQRPMSTYVGDSISDVGYYGLADMVFWTTGIQPLVLTSQYIPFKLSLHAPTKFNTCTIISPYIKYFFSLSSIRSIWDWVLTYY